MKRNIYRALVGLILLSGAGACTPEPVQPEPEFFIRANKDGSAWIVPGSAVYVKAQGELYVFGEQSDGTSTQAYLRLGFTAPTEQLSTVAQAPILPVIPATWTVLLGGDVLVDSYAAANNPSDTRLLVTKLDTVQKVVEGTFDATLRREARWSQQGEMIRFTQGSFRVRYR